MRTLGSLMFVTTLLLSACDGPPSTWSDGGILPATLGCGTTPDGMVGIIAGDTSDLTIHVGERNRFLVHFGICNMTGTYVGLDDIQVTQTRTDRPTTREEGLVVPWVSFENNTATASLDPRTLQISADGEATFRLNDGVLLEGSEMRDYWLIGGAGEMTGDVRFTIGLDTGAFADTTSFPDPARPMEPVELYGNAAIVRRISVR